MRRRKRFLSLVVGSAATSVFWEMVAGKRKSDGISDHPPKRWMSSSRKTPTLCLHCGATRFVGCACAICGRDFGDRMDVDCGIFGGGSGGDAAVVILKNAPMYNSAPSAT